MRAGIYNVLADFGTTEKGHDGYLSMDAYWIVAVVRLGAPLSFSRAEMASVTRDVALGAMTRASKPLVITDDAVHLQVQQSKRSHTGTMNASLKEGGVNYLVEILPGTTSLRGSSTTEPTTSACWPRSRPARPATVTGSSSSAAHTASESRSPSRARTA